MRIAGLNEEQVMHALGIDDAYQVERTLAEGRTGVTQRVTIEGSGPFVRKKIPTALANRAVWAVLADCESPRLPQVAATYEMPDCFVAVYDYIPGDTLEHVMASRGRLGASEATRIVQDVCEAVANLHAHGVIHCDVNPSNIIIAADGAHLIDFGIAQFIGQRPSGDTAALGTWGFAAPEQYGFAPVDARSDVYSVAQVLGYLLVGIAPDPGNDAFTPALDDSRVVSSPLASVVKRGCAFEPSARYQSVEEFSCALQAACGKTGASPAPQGAEGSSSSKTDAGFSPYAAYSAASDRAERREDRVNAIVKMGLISIAVIAAVAGVLILGIGSCSRMLDGFSESFRATIGADSLSAEDKEAISSAAAAAGVQKGFDSAMDSWVAGGGVATSDEVDNAFEALSVVDSGWFVDSNGYIQYAFALNNEHDGFTVEYPTVRIVGKDSKGTVLFSQEQVLPVVAPGQTLYFGGSAGNATPPSRVEFEIVEPQDFAVSKTVPDAPKLEVGNVSATGDGFGGVKFTGEVAYLGGEWPDISTGSVAVTIVLRDLSGGIVYGATAYADRPAEGGSAAFETLGGSIPSYETVEAYAQAW